MRGGDQAKRGLGELDFQSEVQRKGKGKAMVCTFRVESSWASQVLVRLWGMEERLVNLSLEHPLPAHQMQI